jgi:hypothetical protein
MDSILVYDGPSLASNRNWGIRLCSDRAGDFLELQEGDGPWEPLGTLWGIHRFGLTGSGIAMLCAGAFPQMQVGVRALDAATRERLVRLAFESKEKGTLSQRLPASVWESLGLLARYRGLSRSALLELSWQLPVNPWNKMIRLPNYLPWSHPNLTRLTIRQ